MIILKKFSVSVQDTPIIRSVCRVFKQGQLTVITGDNGGGKSTFASSLMGLSGYTVSGELWLDDHEISGWSVEKRAQAGMFLAFQHPIEVPGLGVKTFLHHAYRSCKGTDLSLELVDKKIEQAFRLVGLPVDLIHRNVHEGFSGGQKKRFELAQMLLLEPRVSILDEPDSGLDAQGVSALIDSITAYRSTNPDAIIIIITHNIALGAKLSADAHLIMAAGQLL